MARFRPGVIAVLAAASVLPARGADLRFRDGPERGRFLASCEDLGQFCAAETCGRDQIDAALACRAACPSSVVLAVIPAACPLPPATTRVVLRRKG